MRYLSLILALIMTAALCACGSQEAEPLPAETPESVQEEVAAPEDTEDLEPEETDETDDTEPAAEDETSDSKTETSVPAQNSNTSQDKAKPAPSAVQTPAPSLTGLSISDLCAQISVTDKSGEPQELELFLVYAGDSNIEFYLNMPRVISTDTISLPSKNGIASFTGLVFSDSFDGTLDYTDLYRSPQSGTVILTVKKSSDPYIPIGTYRFDVSKSTASDGAVGR